MAIDIGSLMKIAGSGDKYEVVRESFLQVDFGNMDLSNITFRYCQFDTCNLSKTKGGNFKESSFLECNFVGKRFATGIDDCPFYSCQMQSCVFSGGIKGRFSSCKLEGAVFQDANIRATFTDSGSFMIKGGSISNSHFVNSYNITMKGLDIAETKLENLTSCHLLDCTLSMCELKRCIVSNCNFDNSDFADVRIYSSELTRVSFNGCTFSSIDFTLSVFSDCNFSNSKMMSGEFSAICDNCDFTGVKVFKGLETNIPELKTKKPK